MPALVELVSWWIPSARLRVELSAHFLPSSDGPRASRFCSIPTGDFRRIGSDLLRWWRWVLQSWGKLAKRSDSLAIARARLVESARDCPRGHTCVAPQTWTLHIQPWRTPQAVPEVLDTRLEQSSPTSSGQHLRRSARNTGLTTGCPPEATNISTLWAPVESRLSFVRRPAAGLSRVRACSPARRALFGRRRPPRAAARPFGRTR